MSLYYRGLRSVYDIHRLQSAHTENNRDPGVYCNKNVISGIKLCLSFSHGLKFQVVYFKMFQLLGTPSRRPLDLPPTPTSRSAPGQNQVVPPPILHWVLCCTDRHTLQFTHARCVESYITSRGNTSAWMSCVKAYALASVRAYLIVRYSSIHTLQ